MGFDNYDLIFEELQKTMKKYGYQLGVLTGGDGVITAVFSEEVNNDRNT